MFHRIFRPVTGESVPRTSAPALVAMAFCILPVYALADYRFDDTESYLTEAAALPAWANTLERHEFERFTLENCIDHAETCAGKLKGLRHVIQKGGGLEPDDQLRLVNRYINKHRYRRDRKKLTLSVADSGEAKLRNQWSTLLEFLNRGGDCEDYATAKYFLLRELGFKADDMRIVVSYDRSVREHHAVLAIRRDDNSSWLLESDNTIRKSRQFGYRFIYAINEIGIWEHNLDRQATKIARP